MIGVNNNETFNPASFVSTVDKPTTRYVLTTKKKEEPEKTPVVDKENDTLGKSVVLEDENPSKHGQDG